MTVYLGSQGKDVSDIQDIYFINIKIISLDKGVNSQLVLCVLFRKQVDYMLFSQL